MTKVMFCMEKVGENVPKTTGFVSWRSDWNMENTEVLQSRTEARGKVALKQDKEINRRPKSKS